MSSPKSRIGSCRLHRGAPEMLINSHAVSAFLFDRMFGSSATNHQFVHMNLEERTAILSNDEHRAYLLCGACEQKLCVWEKYLAKFFRQPDGTFPALSSIDPVALVDGAFQIRNLDREIVTRFASSIFWRASISPQFENYSLGPDDEEAFRSYLNNDDGFPANARLTVALIRSSGAPVDQLVSWPSVSRVDAFHRQHVFIALGIHFVLWTGADLPPSVDTMCFRKTGFVIVSNEDSLRDWMVERSSRVTAKGSLAKKLART